MTEISAIVLAAGYGRRIGKPKLMLESDGISYAEIILNKLSESKIDYTLFVINEDSVTWFRETLTDAKYIINHRPDEGMLSSILLAYKQLSKTDNLIIFPVDHPFVKTETLQSITDACKINNGCVIKPSYNGKPGHPIIIPSSILINFGGDTLSKIINSSGYRIISVPADDEGIIKNINTPSDLK